MHEKKHQCQDRATSEAVPDLRSEGSEETGKDAALGYRYTEVGPIPADWAVLPIGRLLKFKNGLNKAKQFFGYGTPIVNYMDVFKNPGLRSTDLAGRVSLTRTELKNFDVRRGDVFFTRTSETPEEIGISAAMLDQPEKTVFSGFVLRGRPVDNSLKNEFKKYCFSSRAVRKQIVSKASYTTRALTNGAALSSVLLPVPPKDEQRAIATALSDADALIESLDRLIAKKRAIKQAAMQQLLTGEIRLPGFEDKWEKTRLGDIAHFHKGSGLAKSELSEDGERPCIHYGELFTYYEEAIREVKSRTNSYRETFEALQNDVLMPTSDVTPNGLATASAVEVAKVAVGGDVLVIRCDEGLLDGEFLACLIRLDRNQVMGLVSGTTVFHIYGRDMANFSFPRPGVREQRAITSVLSDMNAEVEALERRRSKARQVKQGMMQELLTGRTRLVEPYREAAEEAPA